MSSQFPTFTVTANGANVSADVSEITMSLRELVNGQGLTQITLNNYNGKYDASTFWPAFTTTNLLEQGLYYNWNWKINGKGPWYGRVVALEPDVSVKGEVLKVTIAMLDEPLKNTYLTNLILQNTVDKMILKGCQEWGAGTGNQFKMGGITYTVSTSGTPPLYPSPYGYDASKSRIFASDFIKDILLTANDAANLFYGWSGYVDMTQGPTSTTMYLFPQAGKSYASSLTWGTNVSSFKFHRDILRSKNFIEYVGALSPSEPGPGLGVSNLGGDAWTESDLSMWSSANGKLTQITSSGTHWCPTSNLETSQACQVNLTPAGSATIAITVDAASILCTGNPISADLSVQTALGTAATPAPYNALSHNATSLNFYYKAIGLSPPITFPGIGSVSGGNVQLKDSNGFIIQSGSPLFPIEAFRNQHPTWPSWSAPVGALTQFLYKPGGTATGTSTSAQTIVLYWAPVNANTTATHFDWANVTDIIFNLSPPLGFPPSPGGLSLFIDHLYFAQSYQPVALGADQDAINKYGQRMQYYDASMYFDQKSLNSFAAARTTTLSPPLYDLDIVTSLGPESESNGFQPGYIFPAGNVNITNYNLDKVAWRAVEVITRLKVGEVSGGAIQPSSDSGLTTEFHLTPASGPSVGPNPAKFDSRRFW